MGEDTSKPTTHGEGATAPAAGVDLTDVVQQLIALGSLQEFEALLEQRPEVLGPQMLEFLDASARLEGFAPVFRSLVNLLRGARVDREAAWNKYQQRRSEMERLAPELEAGTNAVEASIAACAFDEVIELTERLLPIARESGLGLTVAHLEDLRAQALFRTSSGDRTESIESAIDGFSRALPVALEPVLRTRVLTDLGLAFSERIRGDHAENVERSISYLRAALDELGVLGLPELRAIVTTNLAYGLIRRERGDRVADLRTAVELCRSALEYRSPDRDPDDWAYTQINIGDALKLLVELGEAQPGDALRAYEAVIAEQDRLRERWLAGVAHHSIGRLERSLAQPTIDELLAASEAARTDFELRNRELLESANDHLKAAQALTRTAPDRVRYARVLADLAQTLQAVGEPEEALLIARESMTLTEDTFDPGVAVSVGGTLGSLLAERREWSAAANAFRVASEAAELMFHSRLETASREQEAKSAGNLHRWTAMALACAGRPVAAALVLESGRTRELRRRFRLEPQISDLPDAYGEAYERAVRELASSPLGARAADSGRRLQEVLAEIRAVPGFEHFATGASTTDLAEATQDQVPVVYVNPTPFGTLLLKIQSASDGTVIAEPQVLAVTSTEVLMWLSVAAPDIEEAMRQRGRHSYLVGISGEGTADLRAALDTLLPWLGDVIARPIAQCLRAAGDAGATLIPCGPIGAAPIHGAPWSEGVENRTLIDEFEIRYAPSAMLIARATKQAQEREPPDRHLVALADPLGDLPAARPEVDEIAACFEGNEIRAYGDEASWSFLKENARRASHLRLACHARGGLFDETTTGVVVSDAFVTMNQLSELTGLGARLTAISACQTAIVDINNLPDEGLSIGTVMLAAGSACAIASLWPVDDGATALLMIHLYEEMLTNSLGPPEALRRAQLWLQKLTLDERAQFLSRHQQLQTEFARRVSSRESIGLPGESLTNSSASRTPYSHPYYWAGFVAVGA